MTRFAFCLLLFCSTCFQLSATHIVGGELTYKCLGNDSFEITLTVFRDCYTGIPPFDNPASVGIFDSSWNLVTELLLPRDFSSNDTLPIILSNPCLTVPPNVCAHGTRYVGIVKLPFNPGGYHLVYQRCCRNQLIRNIIRPLATGITIIASISEDVLNLCNNSPTFNQWPPVAICVHEPIDFDHSATDPDGDSLVYRLCVPLHGADSLDPVPQPPYAGPYKEVVWRDPPYNLSNVLGGDPLHIDSLTGFITGVPNTIGNFVVGVCVDEYRDGVLISTLRRDFQYNVAECGKPYAAFFVPEVICDTLAVKFHNQGLQANKYQWYFDWGGNTSLASNVYSPVYVFPDTGTYTIALIAAPDDPCRDTTFQTIHLINSSFVIDANVSIPDCITGPEFTIDAFDTSTDPVNGITETHWELKGPDGLVITADFADPSFILTETGDYTLTLTTTSGTGCSKVKVIPISVPPRFFDVPLADRKICEGDTVALYPAGNPLFMYQWSPSAHLSNPAIANPLASPPENTTYSVTVTYGDCVATDSLKIVIVPGPKDLTATATPNLILPGGTSQLAVTSTNANSFTWQPAASLSNPNIANPVASPAVTTTYTVTAKTPTGCTGRDTVTVELRAVVCDEPYVFFPTAFSPNEDGENDRLKLESAIVDEVYWVIYNRWGEKVFEAYSLDDTWDGSFRGQAQPTETYGYYLKVRCKDGVEFDKKGNVTLLR
ncbi:MAG: gliding motility-associated C-terminal domain-containing protein [Lewinellaceae bacterium]|nr:gliding motility-associated C-terminal domain-containing protein [Lewinellaceae bacterium]